jgi:Double zinc ribbon
MPLALFGIEDGSLNLAVNLLILVLVVFWLALIYWTWSDARRRIADPVLITTATVLSAVVPFIGTIIYTILRPPEFLADAREREVETQASELRMRHLTVQSCPRCEHPIERTWLRCPDCQHRLKDPCRSCSRPVDPRWSICPYCETPLRRSEKRARSRSKESESEGESAPSRRSPAERVKRDKAEERGRRSQPKSSKSQEPAPRASSASKPSPDGEDGEPAPRSRRRSTTTS